MPTTRSECEHCMGALPLPRRSDARYCSGRCRVAALRARRKADAARIPETLTSRARWVRHSAKRPMRIDGKWASTTDPSTWSDFAAVDRSRLGQGIGFVLAPGDDILVVDLDHAVENGELKPWARRIVDALPATYMERGRSGTGLHLWFRGSVPAGRRIRRGDVALEVYSQGRYIIVGERVAEAPGVLAELPDAAWVIASILKDVCPNGYGRRR